MPQISFSSLESNSFLSIFNVINDRSNVADPRGSTTRTFVYDSDPLHKGIAFEDFPYIVVELPSLDYDHPSLDSRHKQVLWKQNIIVRAAKEGAAGWITDAGRNDMLAIGDDLAQTFNSAAIKTYLSEFGIFKLKLEKVDNDTLAIDQRIVYEARYSLTFNHRIKVSA